MVWNRDPRLQGNAPRSEAASMTTQTGPIRPEESLRDIQSISEACVPQRDDGDFLAKLLERSKDALAADTAALLLRDQASAYLRAAAADGLEDEVRQGVRVPVGRGFAGRIAARQQPLIIGRIDHTTVVNPILIAEGIRALMGVPLVVSGAVIGVLHVGSLTPRDFTGQDVELLRLIADRSAMTVLSHATRSSDLLAFASPAGWQSGPHAAVPAGPRRAVMRAWCPHGHSYSPGSFTIIWERCPCRLRPEAGQGHHLIMCHRCATERRHTEINVPKCWYLDF
jgi:hypothetical protein